DQRVLDAEAAQVVAQLQSARPRADDDERVLPGRGGALGAHRPRPGSRGRRASPLSNWNITFGYRNRKPSSSCPGITSSCIEVSATTSEIDGSPNSTDSSPHQSPRRTVTDIHTLCVC